MVDGCLDKWKYCCADEAVPPSADNERDIGVTGHPTIFADEHEILADKAIELPAAFRAAGSVVPGTSVTGTPLDGQASSDGPILDKIVLSGDSDDPFGRIGVGGAEPEEVEAACKQGGVETTSPGKEGDEGEVPKRHSVLEAMMSVQSGASAEDVGIAEDSVSWKSLTRADLWRIVLAFVLPGALATCPVLLPFGSPFARDGDNGIATNWAYYFWYNLVGWGAVWCKIILWNTTLWGREFFLPFMHGHPGIFRCNSSFAAWLLSTAFSVLLFLVGYLIFRNPVPLGTISFGAPCLLVMFSCLYFFVVPRSRRVTLRDHFRIVRCWIPFFLWILTVTVNMSLVWVSNTWMPLIEDPVPFVLAHLAMEATFVALREAMAAMPLTWFLGDMNPDLAMLWNLSYAATCATVSDWILVRVDRTAVGFGSAAGMIFFNLALGWIQFWRAEALPDIVSAFLSGICDVVSGWAFVFIFIYNAFGPNQHVMYIIADLDTQAKIDAIVLVLVNLVCNAVKLALMICVARRKYESKTRLHLGAFGLMAMRWWYWLLLWLYVSTCCACGACMIMMHDGMDFSLKFEEWKGTWPFQV